MSAGERSALAMLAIVLASAAFGDDSTINADAGNAADESGGRLNVDVGTQYDSNVFFVTNDEVSSASAVAQLGSGYRWQGDVTGLDLSINGRYQQYSEESLSAASAIGAAVTLDRDHEFGSTRVAISYSDASSLINAFDNNGKFVGDQREHVASASVQRLFEMSETNSVVASLQGARVKYVDTPEGVRQDDYDFASGSGQWEWQYDERLTFGAGVVGSWYKSDGNEGFSNEVTTFGPALSMRYELGESTSGTLEFSYRGSESKTVYFGFFEQHDAGADYYGHARVVKHFERGYLTLDAGRTVQPGSSGRQDIRDELTTGFGRELTERATFHGSATWLKNAPNNQGSVGSASDRRTAFAGDLGVDYALGERLMLSCGYRYLWQNSDAPDSDARAQTVMLTLRWDMQGASS